MFSEQRSRCSQLLDTLQQDHIYYLTIAEGQLAGSLSLLFITLQGPLTLIAFHSWPVIYTAVTKLKKFLIDHTLGTMDMSGAPLLVSYLHSGHHAHAWRPSLGAVAVALLGVGELPLAHHGVGDDGDAGERREEPADHNEAERPSWLIAVRLWHPRAVLADHRAERAHRHCDARECKKCVLKTVKTCFPQAESTKQSAFTFSYKPVACPETNCTEYERQDHKYEG